ncbi:hypothetical protein [Anaerobacillus alkalilacustris]|uniref:hypothetical protein n=1 Tax=Anaerobacillus alkalilacustris TaxID=393763 RepID=UPI00147258DD|nr:hypothetical protein [Anaerobacillus alkalilacustris]
MDHFDKLSKAVMKEKIHEKFLTGKMATEEMEKEIRSIGERIKNSNKQRKNNL